jgi:hypothetical protein
MFSVFLVIARDMRPTFLLIVSFLLAQQSIYAQRLTKIPQASTAVYQAPAFQGRYFTVTLTNTDTVPILLKLGITKQITNGDTLNLARTYTCSSPTVFEYYDLHDLVNEENFCIRWYTLQQITPKDTLRFVVKLKDFDKSDTSRIYYCYTREIKEADKKHILNTDPKPIYVMKESRDFETSYVVINRDALNTGFAKVGLNIYLSATNQQ